MRRAIIAIGVLAAVVVLGWTAYRYIGGTHAEQKPGAASNPTVPVTPGVAEARDVPVFLRGIGTVQAYNTVTIKSRVDGQIVKVDFTEGQEVKAGDPLFQIDPRPFQAALDAGAGGQGKGRGAARQRPGRSGALCPARRPRLPDAAELRPAEGAGRRSCRRRSRATRRRSTPPAQPELRRHPLADRRAARRAAGRHRQSRARDRQHRRSSRSPQLKPIFVSFTVPQRPVRPHPRERSRPGRWRCRPMAATTRPSSPRAS